MTISSAASLTTNKVTRCAKSTPVPPRFGDIIPTSLFVKTFSDDAFKSSELSAKIQGKDRNECAICKKYSQGPCGSLFKSWLECIDANDSAEESKCDNLIAKLDECLKDNTEYYENIDIYNNEEIENESRWSSFIAELESGHDEDIVYIKDFPSGKSPEMQFRLKDKTGIIMFHPKTSKNGSEQILVLGYVKDQNGAVLAASDDFVEYEGMSMLRFRANENSRDVVACAIYLESDKDEIKDVTIYQRIERIPKVDL